ncbi:hypothetical protein AB0E88_17445 [Streptomyces sp. NPDC028635]|uniref:hypothetical protein n=1 Tax=Streptomyces sp. NPDC028635 TaxID=3154800 RepID=UPI0033F4C97D
MPTEDAHGRGRPAGGAASGALLLCRAAPAAVAPAAHLLREPMLLAGAGEGWSVLVPEGRPWRHGGEHVDRVLTGWATALAVAAPWPVLALWWDADRAGYTLAAGFRRPVGYVWLANGTAAGEDEAMRTFAARLDLDPVLDVQALDHLTRPDTDADARARLRGLLAVLTRAGVDLPAGLDPGAATDQLRQAALRSNGVRELEAHGLREALRSELDAVERAALAPWLPWAATPQARALGAAQLATGLSLALWGLRRHSGGWTAAGALLLAHGALGLTHALTHPRD